MHGLRGRQRDTGGVTADDLRAMAERRERCTHDLLAEAFVGDARHIDHSQPSPPLGREQVFTAQLHTACSLARERGRVLQPTVPGEVLPVPLGVGIAVQIAADHRLRFFVLGDLDRHDALAGADIGVEAREVDELRAVPQRLRHDRVVVTVASEMAVAATLGLGLALGVRIVRIHGLRAVARRRDRRLLHIDPLAVGVLRRQHQRRGRAHRRDLPALGRSAQPEHEDVLARHLRVVGGVVAGLAALIAVPCGLRVGLDRHMAAAATRGPRGVAGIALHLVIVVRQHLPGDVRAPSLGLRIARHRVGARRLVVVVLVAGCRRILDLRHLPLEARRDRRALHQRVAAPLEAPRAIGVADQRKIGRARRGRRTRGAQRGTRARRAMAVLAVDLDRSGHGTV